MSSWFSSDSWDAVIYGGLAGVFVFFVGRKVSAIEFEYLDILLLRLYQR